MGVVTMTSRSVEAQSRCRKKDEAYDIHSLPSW